VNPAIEAMCTTPVTWERWIADAPKGTRQYAIPRTVMCFVAPASSSANVVFQEPFPRNTILMPTHDAAGSPIAAVTSRDRVTLPDGYGFGEPLAPPIRDAHPVFDENGLLDHFEVTA
jgi:hypothetical protein